MIPRMWHYIWEMNPTNTGVGIKMWENICETADELNLQREHLRRIKTKGRKCCELQRCRSNSQTTLQHLTERTVGAGKQDSRSAVWPVFYHVFISYKQKTITGFSLFFSRYCSAATVLSSDTHRVDSPTRMTIRCLWENTWERSQPLHLPLSLLLFCWSLHLSLYQQHQNFLPWNRRGFSPGYSEYRPNRIQCL